MRIPVLAVLFCLPLFAEEQSLERAVELLRDADAPARERGSLMADRRLLAPLLAALQDRDPEVRRRARRTILGLVPGEAEKDDQAYIEAQVRAAINAAAAAAQRGRQMQWVQINHAMRARLQRQAQLTRAGQRLLQRFGIRGGTEKRAPFTPGFRVEQVKAGSPAARLGLAAGDLIIRINGRPVSEPPHFARALAKLETWKGFQIDIHRQKKVLRLPLKPAKPAGR